MTIPLASARDRVLQLADTGDFNQWPAIAAQTVVDGYTGLAIAAVGNDRLAKLAIVERILTAKRRRRAPVLKPVAGSLTAQRRRRLRGDVC